MIARQPREIADRAIWLLVNRGVPVREIMRCVGVSEWTIRLAIQRVESDRYEHIEPSPIRAGERRKK